MTGTRANREVHVRHDPNTPHHVTVHGIDTFAGSSFLIASDSLAERANLLTGEFETLAEGTWVPLQDQVPVSCPPIANRPPLARGCQYQAPHTRSVGTSLYIAD